MGSDWAAFADGYARTSHTLMIRAAFPFVFPSVSGAEAWKPR